MISDKGAELLSYSVRLQVVLKHLGRLLFIVILLFSISLIVSLIFREHEISIRYAIIMAILLILAIPLSKINAPQNLQLNEAFVISALLFIIPSFFMAYAFMGSGISFPDALFEAISGITTGGLSTLDDIESRSRTFLFTRAWMHWYGGLGIVIFYVIFFIFTGGEARRFTYIHINEDDLVGSASLHAKKVLQVYGILTLAGIIFLWIISRDFFNSVIISFSAISTGGFAPYNNSLAHYDFLFQAGVILLSCLGALPFFLYYRWSPRNMANFLIDSSTKRLFLLGLVGAFTLTLLMTLNGFPFKTALKNAPIMALSAQTTAGFSSLDPADLDNGSKLVLIFFMFIGGNTDSTAGGIKIYRFFLMLHLIGLLLTRVSLSKHAVMDISMNGTNVTDEEFKRIMAIFMLFTGIIFFSWLSFAAYGYDPLNSLFEVVSAMSNVGLSTGLSTSGLSTALKFVLCADMLLGRLEVIPILILFHPRTWFGRRMK